MSYWPLLGIVVVVAGLILVRLKRQTMVCTP